MDICPKCGTELPIIGGGAFCANCGEKVDTTSAVEATAAFDPAASAAGGTRPAPSTWTLPDQAPTAVGGEPAGADPYEAYFRPAPGERSPHTMTQVMPAVEPGAYPPGFIPAQPAYDQPIDYQAGPGRPYSEPYDGPYEDEYSDPPPPPRSNRGATIGIGVAAAAVVVIIVSLITLGGGGKSQAQAQTPGSTEVVNPTDPGTSAPPATSQAGTQPSATPSSPTATPHAPGLLELGDKGAEVKWLQARLKQLHVYNGPVSGTFDQATLAAVQQFQNRTHTSDPSGVVGRSTKTALIAAGSRPKLSVAGGIFGGDSKPKPDDVKRLQNALSAALGTKVNASGNYDMATMGAVMQYQSSVGLGPDGTVSDKTWSALQSGKVSG
jgi:peptidoglycan hydrolase-like protein with peptidoglycan-binding domain